MENQKEISALLEEMKELFTNQQNSLTPELTAETESLSHSQHLQTKIDGHSTAYIDAYSGMVFSHDSIFPAHFDPLPVRVQQPIFPAPWIQLTDPNHLAFILLITGAAYKFLHLLPVNRVHEFGFTYQHLLRNKNNGYDCHLLTYQVALCNKEGKPCLLRLQSELCELVPPKNDDRYKIISIEPYNLFKKYKLVPHDKYIAFTPTEQEIIKQVNTGLKAEEIAEIRHRSYKTVRKHFDNIDLKAGIKSISQSCLFAQHLGVIRLIPMIVFLLNGEWCMVE